MCDPLTAAAIAGTVATAGGSFINARANNAAVEAQFDANNQAEEMAARAREAERARQDVIDQESQADLAAALREFDPGARAEQTEAAALDPENPVRVAASPYQDLPQSSYGGGQSIVGRKIADQAARTSSMVDALATLTAQDADFSSTGVGLGELGDRISLDSLLSRDSANVGQFEAQVPAARVSPNNSFFGDALIAAGQGASVLGGGGVNPFANWDLIGSKGAFGPIGGTA